MNLHDDDFTLFALPQRFDLDRAQLDERWRALQGEVHPDRHATAAAAGRRVAMQWAVRVNEAYQRLRDPLRRAAYLCELRGVPVDGGSNTAMPPSFLMQQMAWREALADADGAAGIAPLESEVARHEQALLAELRAQIDERGDMQAAAQTVRALMFVGRFRADIERRLEAMES